MRARADCVLALTGGRSSAACPSANKWFQRRLRRPACRYSNRRSSRFHRLFHHGCRGSGPLNACRWCNCVFLTPMVRSEYDPQGPQDDGAEHQHKGLMVWPRHGPPSSGSLTVVRFQQ